MGRDQDAKKVEDLKSRTKRYALGIIQLYSRLPRSVQAQVIDKQMLRSGTSVGAQYREGCRAKSDADFISKIEGALQELEETAYWLELLKETCLIPENVIVLHLRETEEITLIFTSIVRNIKYRHPKPTSSH
jgi:four helix bundle protein